MLGRALKAMMIAAAVLAGGLPARAGEAGPVVVELFTSQGCAACPPADRMLGELATRDSILALSLHVDYWDYLGWEDSFARSRLTERQRAYARTRDSGIVYTPQFVIAGRTRMPGDQPMKLAMVIEEYGGMETPVSLSLARDGAGLVLNATSEAAFDTPAWVQLVRYDPERTVTIQRGENAGRTARYANVVTSWRRVATWDGAAPLTLEAALDGSGQTAVIIQEAGPGPVLAAARLR